MGRSDVTRIDFAGRVTGVARAGSHEQYKYDTVGSLMGVDLIDDGKRRLPQHRLRLRRRRSRRLEPHESVTTHVGAPAAACGSGTTTTRSWSYDSADRVTNAGWTFDARDGLRPFLRPIGRHRTVDRHLLRRRPGQKHDARRPHPRVRPRPLRRTRSIVSSGAGKPTLTSTNRYEDTATRPSPSTALTARPFATTSGRAASSSPTKQVARPPGDALEYQLRDFQGNIVTTVPCNRLAD